MKLKLTIAIVLVVATINVFGQGKPKKDTISYFSNLNAQSYTLDTLPANSLVWTSFGMKWKPVPNINNADSIYIYVRKSQLRWVNDSTAVITK